MRESGSSMGGKLWWPPAYLAGICLSALPREVLGVSVAQLHESRHDDHDQGEDFGVREVVLDLD